jgi:ribonuclease HII
MNTNKCIAATPSDNDNHPQGSWKQLLHSNDSSVSGSADIVSYLERYNNYIMNYLERYWCDHGSMQNTIVEVTHTGITSDTIPTSATTSSTSSTSPTSPTADTAGTAVAVPANTSTPTITITIHIRKSPCKCKGQLVFIKCDNREPNILTEFYPSPFRKAGVLEVGVDEVGRGCLLGPVTAGAVVWPPDLDNAITRRLIRDSKVLTETQREEAYEYIREHAISWGVASLDNHEIDRQNILQCSIKAMHMAIDETYIAPDHIVVDGNYFRIYTDYNGDQPNYTTVIEGDSKYYSIAAASIMAKVTRDRAMVELVKNHPELEKYGIASNKGYGAKIHTDAIKQYGLTPWHRKSFKPCSAAAAAATAAATAANTTTATTT